MKITSVETFAAPITSRDVLIVKINTSEGISGIGEAYPVGPNQAVAAAIDDFRRMDRGQRSARHQRHLVPPLRTFALPGRLGDQRRY